MIDRFILRGIEQNVQLLAKVHLYMQLQSTNNTLSQIYSRH